MLAVRLEAVCGLEFAGIERKGVEVVSVCDLPAVHAEGHVALLAGEVGAVDQLRCSQNRITADAELKLLAAPKSMTGVKR